MQRLSGLDATFLALETPNNHMHIGAVYIYDRDGDAEALTFERLRAVIESRLQLLPPFRQRLIEVPFGLHHPVWVEDPDFDLEFHLHRAVLAAPGDVETLAAYAADAMSRQLDRRHPLWEMHLIEGLRGDRVAVLTKIHHAAIDGASGAELTARLLDISREPADTTLPTEPWTPDRIPSDTRLLAEAVNELGKQPRRLLAAVKETVGTLKHVREQRTAALTEHTPVPSSPRPFSAPRTSINTPVTPHRVVAFADMPLEEMRAIRRAFGGTINDVVMAVCAGALRRYLEDRDELPAEPLVAMVPISVRATGEEGSVGNRITNMLVSLHTEIADPVERLQALQEATKSSKEMAGAIGANTLSSWTEFAAPALAARAARLYASMKLADRLRPVFNLTISNLPGPQFPLYSAGARLVAWYPMGPIFDGVGLNITVMSYMGVVHVGLVACREATPDVAVIGVLMGTELAGLAAAAAAVGGSRDKANRAGPTTQTRAPQSAKASKAGQAAKAGQSAKAGKAPKAGTGAKSGPSSKAAKPAKAARPAKAAKPAKAATAGKPARTTKPGEAAKVVKPVKAAAAQPGTANTVKSTRRSRTPAGPARKRAQS